MAATKLHVAGASARWEHGGWAPPACGHRRASWRPSARQAVRRGHTKSTAGQLHTAAAAAAEPAAAAAAEGEPPVPHPSRLRLGADIPIALRSVTVAGCTFLLLVPDIDAVMEMYIAAGQADRDPYWCEPWPSALAMSAELLNRPHLVARQRVCELGCGLGLAGLAAAVAGAAEVVLLDREPLSLQCALVNAEINGLAVATPKPGSSSSGSSVQAPSLEQLLQYLPAEDVQRLQEHQRQLLVQRERQEAAAAVSSSGSTDSDGGSDAGSSSGEAAPLAAAGAAVGGAALPPPSGVVRAEVFDWSEPVTIAPHDVMLVCDCLYESFSVQPVAEVAPKLLKPRSGSRLLLADPPDRARHNRECFLDILCEESGEFLVEEAAEARVPTWEESKRAWRDVPIALMHLRRSAGGDTVGMKLRRRE